LFYLIGASPAPHFIFFLHKKNEAKKHLTRPKDTLSNWRGEKGIKVFDFTCFSQKTSAQLAKTVQTHSFVAQTGQFQTPTSLVFWFTR
jgi:hypothetical protein